MHINIHTAKDQLSKYIHLAASGEEVIIAKNNKPLVKIVAINPPKPKRTLGGVSGLIINMPDDFNEPLEDFAPYSH